MAIPAIRELLFYKYLAGIVIPGNNKALEEDLLQLPECRKELLITVTRKDFPITIEKLLREKNITACFIMTFPFIIPEKLLALPPKGFVNFHYGALPQYRGPHPILAQMLAGENMAAVSIHVADKGIDTGPIIMKEYITIEDDDTFGRLQAKLSFKAASMLGDLIKVISFGSFVPAVAQDETKAAYHKKPGAADLFINWEEMSGEQIIRVVNACNPWNKGAGSFINSMVIGITECEMVDATEFSGNTAAGTIVNVDAGKGLIVQCKDARLIRIMIIYTPEGFMSGHRITAYGIKKGDRFLTLRV